MEQFISTLRQETALQAESVGADDPAGRSLALSDIYRQALRKLREFVLTYAFRDEREEIRFFREIKPWFLSRQMFHRKVYSLEIGRPVDGAEAQAEYFENEIAFIRGYAEKYSDFYRYYRSGETCLDAVYFTRRASEKMEHYRECFDPERDPAFSTLCDFKVALLLAGEMIVSFMRSRAAAARNLDQPDSPADRPDGLIRWTATKSGLIEMLYSWDSMGAFDNGEIPLVGIQKFIERHFGIHLGNISRTFNEMKSRNNPTPFLDSMKEAVLRRMERDPLPGHKRAYSGSSRTL